MWSARGSGIGPADRGERALERQPVEVLHDDVERAVGELPGEEDLHDVRVREARRDLGLAVEARDELWFAESSRWRIFTATSRSMPFWKARYTRPIAPMPTSCRISMCPRISRPT